MVELSDLKNKILLKVLNDRGLEIIAEKGLVENYHAGQLIFQEEKPTTGI